MQVKRILGTGAALLTLSLGAQAFAQAVPSDTYIPPPVQPIPAGQPAQPGQPMQPGYPGQPAYGGQPIYPGQPGYPNQPAYAPQPGQPMYGYPPGSQPPPGYFQPAPPPRQVVNYKMQPRIGLIVGGSVMLGSMWLITAIAGGISATVCDVALSGGGSSGCSTPYWPLFVPVAGPFIQMGYVPHDSTRGLALIGLAFDGLVQVGGLAMLIVGATVRQRVPVYAKNWQVAPMFTSSGTGLAFTSRF